MVTKKSGDDIIKRCVSLSVVLSILILCFYSGIVQAEESSIDDLGGELHCYLGIIGITLVIFTLGFGFLTSGRFQRFHKIKTKPFHLFLSLFLTFFLSGEFLYGLLKVHWSFIPDYHGILGSLTLILAWLSTIMSPCIAGKKINWKVSSKIHTILAFLLLLFIIAQVLNGYLFLEG